MAVVVVSKDLNKSGILAGDIAKKVGGFMGGGGGGKPHLQPQVVKTMMQFTRYELSKKIN